MGEDRCLWIYHCHHTDAATPVWRSKPLTSSDLLEQKAQASEDELQHRRAENAHHSVCIYTMKALFGRCKTSSIDVNRSFKSTILYDNDDVEPATSSLSGEAVSIQLLNEILSEEKESHWQILKKTQFLGFRLKCSVWHNITKQNIFRGH